MSKVTTKDLFEAGVHLGHKSQFWNPEMSPYIFGVRDKVHIIDLDKTITLYREAVSFAENVARRRGKILFVGTKGAAYEIVKEEAERCGMPYVDNRWLGGMLTNYKTIRQSLKRLKELENRKSNHEVHLTKKEQLVMDRDISRLSRSLGGIKEMNGLPDALVIIDVGHEKIAVSEAKKLMIPIIGVVDSNNSPSGINYVIPGNDDSAKAIKLYLSGIADAIITVKEALKEEDRKAAALANENKSQEEVKVNSRKFGGHVSTPVIRRVASAVTNSLNNKNKAAASSVVSTAGDNNIGDNKPVLTGKIVRVAARTNLDLKNSENNNGIRGNDTREAVEGNLDTKDKAKSHTKVSSKTGSKSIKSATKTSSVKGVKKTAASVVASSGSGAKTKAASTTKVSSKNVGAKALTTAKTGTKTTATSKAKK